MKTINANKNLAKAQEQIRLIAINLREEGKTYSEISKIIGVCTTTIWNWYQNYKKHGKKGLKNKKRGAKSGTNSRLTIEQLITLERTLIEKSPINFDLYFSLWSRQAIQSLVLKLWSIFMPLRTVTDYMKRLNFTPQKPIKRAYEQNSKSIKRWIEEDYPKIKKRAYEEKAEIHWLDETRISSNSNYIRGFSPKGKTPLINMKAKQMNINVISSITNKGKMRFMPSWKFINTENFMRFVNDLCNEIDRKIFLILDNLPVHHSKLFTSWLKKNTTKIEVFYLPSYSPELNPDERLNRDLKTHFHSGPISKNKEDFMNKLMSFLIKIQKSPNRVINCFHSELVKYAA